MSDLAIFLNFQLHGTYRRKDRVYTENTFYGKGKSIAEATPDEIKADIEERKSENPKAYRDKLEFSLSKSELKEMAKKNNKNK